MDAITSILQVTAEVQRDLMTCQGAQTRARAFCLVGQCFLCFVSRTPKKNREPWLLKGDPGEKKPLASEVYRKRHPPNELQASENKRMLEKLFKQGTKGNPFL